MDWAYIIVVILAIIFILFLVVGVTLLVMIISVTRRIKHVSKTAHDAAALFEQSTSRARAISFFAERVKQISVRIAKHKKRKTVPK